MTAARILIAVLAQPQPTVKKALDGYRLVVVENIEHAEQLLHADSSAIDLFVIGILFDDSRAMELIRMIRLDITRHATPILMVRLMPSHHEEMLRHVMQTMIALGTVSNYLECDYRDRAAEKEIRAAAEDCLRSDKRLKREDGQSN